MDKKDNSALTIALKGIALILGLFILGNIIGSLTNIKKTNTLETVTNQTTAQSTTLPPATEPTEAQPTETVPTTEPTTEETTTVPTTKDTTPDTTEEIVELFNKSVNKVKPTAKRVIRNYENLSHDKALCDYPMALQLKYGSLIDSWLVNHETPIEYNEADLIKANFPVKGKDWSSKLTAKDVDKAQLTEKDGNYHISLELSYCKDPAEDTGVCSVMEEIDLEKVKELIDLAVSCETEYYDCTVDCIIEKATGNMIYVRYSEPVMLNLTTQRFTQLKATFALKIESEFEIEY